MPSANLTFINVSIDFKMSLLSDHATSDGHTRVIKEPTNKKAIAAGLVVAPHKVVKETPTYFAIGAAFKRVGETKKAALKRLFEILHHIAVNEQPFTDFKDHIQLKKFMESNLNLVHMKMKTVESILFKKIYTRNLRMTFITIFCNGTTVTIISEQEIVFIFFFSLFFFC